MVERIECIMWIRRLNYKDLLWIARNALDLDLKEEIMKYDVIIIMSTDANLPAFGWGFIENLYDMFQGKNIEVSYAVKLARQRKVMQRDANWMEMIKQKAIKNNISVDSMLTLDAGWVIQNETKK